jgi:hypothetical protein
MTSTFDDAQRIVVVTVIIGVSTWFESFAGYLDRQSFTRTSERAAMVVVVVVAGLDPCVWTCCCCCCCCAATVQRTAARLEEPVAPRARIFCRRLTNNCYFTRCRLRLVANVDYFEYMNNHHNSKRWITRLVCR